MQVSVMSVTSRLAWTRSTPSSETLSNRKRILSLARLFDFDLPLLGMFSGAHKWALVRAESQHMMGGQKYVSYCVYASQLINLDCPRHG